MIDQHVQQNKLSVVHTLHVGNNGTCTNNRKQQGKPSKNKDDDNKLLRHQTMTIEAKQTMMTNNPQQSQTTGHDSY
jgi:hypothetical protein